MQAERIQVLVQQAAAGNVEAFVALVQEFAPALRVALGAHLDQPAAVGPVEMAVWSSVRNRLGEWLPDTPFDTWLMQVATGPVAAHLAQADRRAIDIQDALSHQVIEQCRAALADGSELQALDLPAIISALPDGTRTLLLRRYRERQRPTVLAANLMISEAELATSLSAARAACDWRGLAKPPGPGDRLLPPLIEDWLNGTIDVDSRALLATNLGRDPQRAQQFDRQVRVHVTLGAALAPFTREDAVAITRQAGVGAGDSGRVMMGENLRPVSGPRPPASDARRAARMSISNRQTVPHESDAPRPSPMPWIIGGGMVLVGVFALVAMSLRAGPTKAAPPPRPEPVAPPVVAAPTGAKPDPATNSGVLRLEPGRSNVPPPPPPRAKLTLDGHVYANRPAVLRADLSHNLGVTAVEFWKGDQRVASVSEPFAWTWEQPTIGTTSFTLRVLGTAGTLSSSEPTPVTVDQAYGSGAIRREWWTGVEGFTIAEGFKANGYPDRPQGEGDEGRFASPRNWNDHYLERLRGFITPPLDGDYVFWIAGDDESQLWLSRDDQREGLQLIAVSPLIPNFGIQPEEWEHSQSQRSGVVTLKRGQRYYVEVLHKEGNGEDHVSVGWRLPDGRLERPIPGAHLSSATEPVPASPPQPPAAGLPAPVVAPVPPAGPGAPGAQLVRSIDFVSSGATYVDVPARNGEQVYIDREYKLVDLPSTFEVGRLIRTRNDDDGASANPHLRFTADVAVDVYLAYATTATALPAWMQDWTSTEVLVGADQGGGFRLFRRTFPAGQVLLGANERNATSASSNYFVLVLPATQAPVPMTWKVVRAINLGGEAIEFDGMRLLGHRQAEAEEATPVGSHRPGPWLSDLPWIRGKTSIGEIRRNRSMEERPITIDGKVYAKGLGVHAPSELVYALDGSQSGFTAVVGVDDEVQGVAELSFQVWLDGHKAWDSGVMRKGQAKPVAVPLMGRKELRLVVDSNGPWDWDHADWANAQFLVPGGGDGVLQVRTGRRTAGTFVPKPAVDAKVRTMLGTALVGTKEGLSFRVKVPDGRTRVWLWLGENGTANSRQFDLTVEGVTMPGVGMLPAGGWEKLGPLEVDVADGHIDVSATPLKGMPQLMGIVVEQQVTEPLKPMP